jgi:hypothetical protein
VVQNTEQGTEIGITIKCFGDYLCFHHQELVLPIKNAEEGSVIENYEHSKNILSWPE